MTDFDKLIKDLTTEIEALKTIRRKSSLTLTTTTKTATGTAVAYYTGHVSTLTRAALIKTSESCPGRPQTAIQPSCSHRASTRANRATFQSA